jgi:hypothetical protein
MRFKDARQHTKKAVSQERAAAREAKKAERLAKASNEWKNNR